MVCDFPIDEPLEGKTRKIGRDGIFSLKETEINYTKKLII